MEGNSDVMKTETHRGRVAAPRRGESVGLEGGSVVQGLAEQTTYGLARKVIQS